MTLPTQFGLSTHATNTSTTRDLALVLGPLQWVIEETDIERD